MENDNQNLTQNQEAVSDIKDNKNSQNKKKIYIILGIVGLILVAAIIFLVCKNEKERRDREAINSVMQVIDNAKGTIDDVKGKIYNAEEDVSNSRELVKQKIFNMSFANYQGENKGRIAKRVIESVITNNSTNKDYIIAVQYGERAMSDIEELRGLRDVIVDDNLYTIDFNYGDNGYINEAIIKEKAKQEKSDTKTQKDSSQEALERQEAIRKQQEEMIKQQQEMIKQHQETMRNQMQR